jgi:hypothetical protein
VKNNQTSKYFLDTALAAAFLAAFFSDQTGTGLHQWIGVTAAALAAWHLVSHWDWVCAITRRLLGKLSGQSRWYYLFDVAIFAGFLVTGVTGLGISTWLDLSLRSFTTWVDVHVWASILTLALTAIKLAMHWRWIVTNSRRIFSRPARAPRLAPAPLRPIPAVARVRSGSQMSRRDFIKVLGIVGAASYLAVRSAAAGLSTAAGGAVTEAGGTVSEGTSNANIGNDSISTTSGTPSTSQSSSSSSSSSLSSSQFCSVRCNRNCSFPGRCDRYTDTNNNGKCDNGECM